MEGRCVMRQMLFAVIWVVLCATGAGAGPYEDAAKSAYESGDYTRAAQLTPIFAEQGEAWAQRNMGVMYMKGLGVPKDEWSASMWFEKAAEKGDTLAQYYLAWMYDTGQGTLRQNLEKAAKWYRQSASQGNADAQYRMGYICINWWDVSCDAKETVNWYRQAADQGNALAMTDLGNMYYRGNRILKNFKEAATWYRKAAELGNEEAQVNLGEMYRDGHGVSQDEKAAVTWFRKAAEQGNHDGMFHLAESYRMGQGMGKNISLAYMWHSIAASKRDGRSSKNLDEIEQKMSSEQLQKAQELAQRCQDTQYKECG